MKTNAWATCLWTMKCVWTANFNHIKFKSNKLLYGTRLK